MAFPKPSPLSDADAAIHTRATAQGYRDSRVCNCTVNLPLIPWDADKGCSNAPLKPFLLGFWPCVFSTVSVAAAMQRCCRTLSQRWHQRHCQYRHRQRWNRTAEVTRWQTACSVQWTEQLSLRWLVYTLNKYSIAHDKQ